MTANGKKGIVPPFPPNDYFRSCSRVSPMSINNGATLSGEFVTILETGKGLDLGIRMIR